MPREPFVRRSAAAAVTFARAAGAPPTPSRRPRVPGLRARLLGLLALVLLPCLGLVLYTQADERKAAIAGVNRDALRLIAIATSNQAAQIEAARELLTAFAQLPHLRANDAAACSAALAGMLAAYPLYVNFAVADPDGNVRCSAVPMQSRVNLFFRSNQLGQSNFRQGILHNLVQPYDDRTNAAVARVHTHVEHARVRLAKSIDRIFIKNANHFVQTNIGCRSRQSVATVGAAG